MRSIRGEIEGVRGQTTKRERNYHQINTEKMNEKKDYDSNQTQLFEKLITVEDLADAFGFAPQTVRNWVALRQIPFIRIGGKTRFRHKSIEAWIALKENKPCQ